MFLILVLEVLIHYTQLGQKFTLRKIDYEVRSGLTTLTIAFGKDVPRETRLQPLRRLLRHHSTRS
jgi:hypothetical protein